MPETEDVLNREELHILLDALDQYDLNRSIDTRRTIRDLRAKIVHQLNKAGQ